MNPFAGGKLKPTPEFSKQERRVLALQNNIDSHHHNLKVSTSIITS